MGSSLENQDHQFKLALIDEDTPKLKVAKANALVEAQYQLSSKEHKLILIAMAQIRKDQTQLFEQVFQVKELMILLDSAESSAYAELNRLAKGLMKKQVEVRNDETGEWELYQWVTKAYCKRGLFGIRFSEDLKPFLIGLVGKYTLYELSRIIRMSSSYSVRLYELLKQYEAFGTRTFSLDPKLTQNENWVSFPKLMGYDCNNSSYARFSNVNQRILKPAIKEVQDLTEFKQVGIKIVRFNRRPIALKFTWKTVDRLEDVTEHPLYPDMLAIGVSKATAKSIFVDYDEDRIARNLAYIKQAHRNRKIDSPAAYLLNALQEDYADPELPLPLPEMDHAPGRSGSGRASEGHNNNAEAHGARANDHPLYRACENMNEFKLVLSAEAERGAAFNSFNEFHKYQLESKFRKRGH